MIKSVLLRVMFSCTHSGGHFALRYIQEKKTPKFSDAKSDVWHTPKHEAERKVRIQNLSKPREFPVRILLWAPPGSGKSSFAATAASATQPLSIEKILLSGSFGQTQTGHFTNAFSIVRLPGTGVEMGDTWGHDQSNYKNGKSFILLVTPRFLFVLICTNIYVYVRRRVSVDSGWTCEGSSSEKRGRSPNQ